MEFTFKTPTRGHSDSGTRQVFPPEHVNAFLLIPDCGGFVPHTYRMVKLVSKDAFWMSEYEYVPVQASHVLLGELVVARTLQFGSMHENGTDFHRYIRSLMRESSSHEQFIRYEGCVELPIGHPSFAKTPGIMVRQRVRETRWFFHTVSYLKGKRRFGTIASLEYMRIIREVRENRPDS